MPRTILSGDLGIFRLEMVVRILEAIKFEGGMALEAIPGAQLCFSQGKIVGAQAGAEQGLAALGAFTAQRSGGFAVFQTEGAMLPPQDELAQHPDNAAIFRQLQQGASTGRLSATVPAPRAAAAQPAYPMPGATPGAAPPRPTPTPTAAAPDAKSTHSGPLARVPDLTDKGRTTLRTLQTNRQLRGTAVEADHWRVLEQVDGKRTLFTISEAINLVGPKFLEAVDLLQREGHLRYSSGDDLAKAGNTKFRFGEYMISKGIITEAQLETALRRQQEVARRGRYQWLGEILIEMNFARPSQVQEALAIQKRMGG